MPRAGGIRYAAHREPSRAVVGGNMLTKTHSRLFGTWEALEGECDFSRKSHRTVIFAAPAGKCCPFPRERALYPGCLSLTELPWAKGFAARRATTVPVFTALPSLLAAECPMWCQRGEWLQLREGAVCLLHLPQPEHFTSSMREAPRVGEGSCVWGCPLLCTATVCTGGVRRGSSAGRHGRAGAYGSAERKFGSWFLQLCPHSAASEGQQLRDCVWPWFTSTVRAGLDLL